MVRTFKAILILGTLSAALMSAAQSWRPVGWGGGGLYWSVAFHPKSADTIYMGGDVLGVYKSVDRGRTWKHINQGIVGYEVLSLAVDPSAPERLYACTSNGVSRSENGGASWKTLEPSAKSKLKLTVEKGKSIRVLAVDPKNSRRLAFAAPDGRILESTDFGANWTLRHQVDGFASCVAYSPQGKLFAATSTGLIQFEKQPRTALRQAVRAIAFNGTRAYAAAAGAGVWVSSDGGNNWKATGLKTEKGQEWLDVAVSKQNPDRVQAIAATGWSGAHAWSADGGKSWKLATQIRADAAWNPTDLELAKAGPVNLSNPRNLALSPVDDRLAMIAANWRPALSDDGGATWRESSRGADISVVTDIQFHEGKSYVTAMDEGLFVSDDSPLGWKQLFPVRWSKEDSGHVWRVRIWDQGKQILAASSPWDDQVNQALRSLDGGKTVLRVRDGLPTGLPKQNTMWGRGYPRALSADPANPYTVYLGIDGDDGGGVFKSTDGGWHWARLANQPGSLRMFYGLVVDPTEPKRIFWGACGTGGGVYRSEDGGESWKRVFAQEEWVFNLHVDANGTVYAPGKELWASRDHGTTWKKLTNQSIDVHIVGLEIDPSNPARIWFSRVPWDGSASGGVYESTDSGATWREITGDLPNRKPLVLRFNPLTKELWAGGTGLFALKRP